MLECPFKDIHAVLIELILCSGLRVCVCVCVEPGEQNGREREVDQEESLSVFLAFFYFHLSPSLKCLWGERGGGG